MSNCVRMQLSEESLEHHARGRVERVVLDFLRHVMITAFSSRSIHAAPVGCQVAQQRKEALGLQLQAVLHPAALLEQLVSAFSRWCFWCPVTICMCALGALQFVCLSMMTCRIVLELWNRWLCILCCKHHQRTGVHEVHPKLVHPRLVLSRGCSKVQH